MTTLTKNNHFKFGYGDLYLNDRVLPTDTWNTAYGVARPDLWSFRDECRNTATLIAETTDRPIYVGLSGGMDSEVVANAFQSAGVPFTPLIAVYDDGVNEYDIKYAKEWCRHRNITPLYFNIDVSSYWKTKEAVDLAKSTHCISPQFLIYMKIIQHVSDIGGFPVFGSAECYLENNQLPPHMFEREKVSSIYRYCLKNEINSAIGFFQYTPEIMLSYLLDPVVSWKVQSGEFSSSKEFKYEFYRRHFDINHRESTSGFASIWRNDKVLRDKLIELMPWSDSVNKHDYHALVNSLRGKL